VSYYISQFFNSEFTSPTDRYNFTMTTIFDVIYDSVTEGSSADGTFPAICLSGIRTEDNTTAAVDSGDATLANSNLSGSATVGFSEIKVIVRPQIPLGDIIPDLVGQTDPSVINDLIDAHATSFTATSEASVRFTNVPQFGQKLRCYLEKINDDDIILRFKEPVGVDIDLKYSSLASIEGVRTSRDLDWNSARLLGDASGQPGATTSKSQKAFEDKLGAALKAKGLPFKVTDRSRTVDDQIQRIMNKYNNNGPEEVVATYGKNRGARMVTAIRTGDQATLRKLASQSSKHLKGNAIDIRSWHYTNEQMTVVLQEIRKLGGDPLVENIKGCWTKSGRNVTVTQRIAGAKAGGQGKNTPCHNEHIHIDIPEDFS